MFNLIDGKNMKQLTIKLEDFKSNSILLHIIEHGLNIHFECQSGYCGACRAKLISGEIKYINSPLAFIGKDQFLTCCSIPCSDIVIELL